MKYLKNYKNLTNRSDLFYCSSCAFLLELCPLNASYYSNRSAAKMMCKKFQEALEDSQAAIKVDNTFAKVLFSLFHLLISLLSDNT